LHELLIDFKKIAPGRALKISEQVDIAVPVDFGVSRANSVFSGMLRHDGEAYRLEGEGSAEIEMACGCCLTAVTLHLNFAVEQGFVNADAEIEDDEAVMLTDKEVDIMPFIAAGLYQAIPMRAECSPDCRGLCAKCGANLNVFDCHCPKDEINEDYAVMLQGLKLGE